MNLFVADPAWHGYILWYFFLGGIAAGSYAVACLASLVGTDEDRRGVRVAHYLAFPLVCLCGLILIIDLGRPERFWHMMIQSETYRPMFKGWSPMSAGSWGLSAFGAFSFLSFAGAAAEDNRWGLGRWSATAHRLRRGTVGRLFTIAGAAPAFFLGSYTGALLSASNQPIWSNTTWLAPLFLASSASTGVALMILFSRWRFGDVSEEVVGRLEHVDLWAILLELAMLIVMVASVGDWARPAFLRWPGLLIPFFVLPAGLLIPLGIKRWKGRVPGIVASVLVLLGGFALRAALIGIPPSILVAGR